MPAKQQQQMMLPQFVQLVERGIGEGAQIDAPDFRAQRTVEYDDFKGLRGLTHDALPFSGSIEGFRAQQ